MPVLPSQYDVTPPYELLREAEMGRIGFDHRLIRSLLDRPTATSPALKRFASEYREKKVLDLETQIFDLFRALRTPDAIPFYFHLMQSGDDGIPDEIVEAFAELGAPAVDPLLERYRQLGLEDGADLAFLLAALGVRDQRILDVLIETLDRDIYEGGISLGLYGDPAARPAVEAAMSRVTSPAERKALEDCLLQIDAPRTEATHEPYDIWEEYPETALPEFDLLSAEDCLTFLDVNDPAYRREAALSFSGDGYSAAVRRKLMEHARGDEDEAVRAACLNALGESLDDRNVVKLLLDTLNDTSKPLAERGGALVGLARESKRPEVDRFIREFYANPQSRDDALHAIVRSKDGRYKKQVLESLESDNLDFRSGAVAGVGALGLSEAAGQLRAMFEDEDLRPMALHVYAFVAPSRNTSKAIEQLYQDIEEMANGLTVEEGDLVGHALDSRLEKAGLPPVFFPDDEEIDESHDHSHDHGHHHGGPQTFH